VESTQLAREIKDHTRAPQLDTVVGMKLRTVLVIQEPRERIPEYVILKLAALTKIAPTEQAKIRDAKEPSLFHLPAGRYGLDHERAVDLNSLARVHKGAIPAGRPVGKLDANMMRVLDERLAKYLELDLSTLIKAEAAAIVEGIRKLAEQA
jgi:hypothetical protein